MATKTANRKGETMKTATIDNLHPRCSQCQRAGTGENALWLGVAITILDNETEQRTTCTAGAEFCHWCRSKEHLKAKAIEMCQFAFSDKTSAVQAALAEANETEKR